MFRPNLKRSKINQQSSLLALNRTTLPEQSVSKQKVFLYEKTLSPQLYMPSLLQKNTVISQSSHQGIKKISPLKFWDVQYPPGIKQILNEPIQKAKSRLIGTKYGIYWLIIGDQLYIWRYDSFQNPSKFTSFRRYDFDYDIRTVTIGHMDKDQCSQFCFKQNTQLLAVGYSQYIELCSVNMLNCEVVKLDIRLKVQSDQNLQKIHITDNNQIYFTGDQGFLTRFTFNNPTPSWFGNSIYNKSTGRPSLLSNASLRSSIHLTRSYIRTYTQNIVTTKHGRIYVLIRKQSQSSLLRKLGLSIRKFFSGKVLSEQNQYFVQKQIHVYNLDKKTGSLQFSGVINNNQIQQKLKQNYSQKDRQTIQQPLNITQKNHEESNSIINIFITKLKKDQEQGQQRLSIVTNRGYYVTLRQNVKQQQSNINNFSFQDIPKRLPQQLFIKSRKQFSTACFLNPINGESLPTSQIQIQGNQLLPLADRNCILLTSYGTNNLNILNNGLCFYFDQNQIQVLKLQAQPVLFMQQNPSPVYNKMTQNSSWIAFSKKQITIIRKSQPYQYLVSSLTTLNQVYKINTTNPQKISQQFQLYANQAIKDIVRIIGSNQISGSLFKFFIKIIRQRTIHRIKTGKLNKQDKMDNKSFKSDKTNQTDKSEKKQQKYQPTIFTTSLTQQMNKQENKFRQNTFSRLRYQNLVGNTTHNIFSRWLLPKRKQIRIHANKINEQIQVILWRYYIIYNLQNNASPQNFTSSATIINQFGQKMSISIPYFSYCLIKLFHEYYKIIKDMKIASMRCSPILIQQLKISLITLMQFLEQKKICGNNLSNFNLYRLSPEQKNVGDALYQKKTNPTSANSSILSTNSSNNINFTMINQEVPNVGQSQIINEQISNQIYKVIHRLLDVIDVYEIIASNLKRMYENIPTINQFMQNLPARKVVKSVILDIFGVKQLQKNPIIANLHRKLPQLNLSSDIYLSQWLNFIKLPQNLSKQFQTKSTMSSQIRVSNLHRFTQMVQIQQILTTKQFFKQNLKLYLQILVQKLQSKKSDIRLINQRYGYRTSENKVKKVVSNALDLQIFQWDRIKIQKQWMNQLNNQIVLIRNQINIFLQELAVGIECSQPVRFEELDRQFDDCTKLMIQKTEQGIGFIINLINFLRQRGILPQKIQRLCYLTGTLDKYKSEILNNLPINKDINYLDSLTLINTVVKKSNQPQMLTQLIGKKDNIQINNVSKVANSTYL